MLHNFVASRERLIAHVTLDSFFSLLLFIFLTPFTTWLRLLLVSCLCLSSSSSSRRRLLLLCLSTTLFRLFFGLGLLVRWVSSATTTLSSFLLSLLFIIFVPIEVIFVQLELHFLNFLLLLFATLVVTIIVIGLCCWSLLGALAFRLLFLLDRVLNVVIYLSSGSRSSL